MTGDFLLDPRRLTVALSRATSKMILVASRSVFSLFSADEEMFVHAQLWKNLLRYTCTVPLWSGERDGEHVEVWGNAPSRETELDKLGVGREERFAYGGTAEGLHERAPMCVSSPPQVGTASTRRS